jgi:hypothetical protein
MSWFNRLVARFNPPVNSTPLAPPPQYVAPAPVAAAPVYVPPVAPPAVMEVPVQPPVAPLAPPTDAQGAGHVLSTWSYNPSFNLAGNYQLWIDAGRPPLDAAGNPAGALVMENLLQQKHAIIPFAGTNSWQEVLAEVNAWMNTNQEHMKPYPADWRTRKCSLTAMPNGADCHTITESYNAMIDQNVDVSVRVNYILEANPDQLVFEPGYGRPIWATLTACFTGTGSSEMRQSLGLADNEGFVCRVEISGNGLMVYPLDKAPYWMPLASLDPGGRGAVSLHGGFPAFGKRY